MSARTSSARATMASRWRRTGVAKACATAPCDKGALQPPMAKHVRGVAEPSPMRACTRWRTQPSHTVCWARAAQVTVCVTGTVS
jgi:hypothetical protein